MKVVNERFLNPWKRLHFLLNWHFSVLADLNDFSHLGQFTACVLTTAATGRGLREAFREQHSGKPSHPGPLVSLLDKYHILCPSAFVEVTQTRCLTRSCLLKHRQGCFNNKIKALWLQSMASPLNFREEGSQRRSWEGRKEVWGGGEIK